MKQFNKQGFVKPAISMRTLKKLAIVLTILPFAMTGCKKSDDLERDYGYAKVIVKCDKCHVSYLSSGQVNEFVVDDSTATNFIRYKKDYTLDINIRSVDAEQELSLSVYSRNGKQTFRKSTVQKPNETWISNIVIP